MTLLDFFKAVDYNTPVRVFTRDFNSLLLIYTGLIDDLPDDLMEEVVMTIAPYGFTDPITKFVNVGLSVYVDYNIHISIKHRKEN